MGDDKAPRAAVLEILQDALRGQSPAQAAGDGAGTPSVFCGKTKVFLANSLVSAVPWLLPQGHSGTHRGKTPAKPV